MRQDLRDKVVFITGAARGIGAETARQLAARGARVSLVGMEPERLEALCRELGPGHAFFACDVTDQVSLERAVLGTVKELGGIDVVVANAGIANNGTVAVNPADALCRTVEVNLNGVIRTVSATLPHVTARKGYFLLVSSAAALRAMPGMAAYAASKVGVEHFAQAFRLEVEHKGVGVGVAHPGWVDTDLVRDARHELRAFNEMVRRLPGPFGATTRLEDCARAFVRAIERRERQLFVPRALAVFAALRPLLWSRLFDAIASRDARALIPELEREVEALGRWFGKQSAEVVDGPRSGTRPAHAGG